MTPWLLSPGCFLQLIQQDPKVLAGLPCGLLPPTSAVQGGGQVPRPPMSPNPHWTCMNVLVYNTHVNWSVTYDLSALGALRPQQQGSQDDWVLKPLCSIVLTLKKIKMHCSVQKYLTLWWSLYNSHSASLSKVTGFLQTFASCRLHSICS